MSIGYLFLGIGIGIGIYHLYLKIRQYYKNKNLIVINKIYNNNDIIDKSYYDKLYNGNISERDDGQYAVL